MWKYIAGGGTVLGYQAFYDRLASKSKTLEVNNTIKEINNKIDLLQESINKSNDKSDIISINKEIVCLKDSLKELIVINNKYSKLLNENATNINSDPNSLFEPYKEEFSKAFDKAKDIADKIEKSSNMSENNINKFNSSGNNLENLINEFNDYLSNLSLTEICLVINIFSYIFILTCIITIIFSVYGNIIINKLSLEKKYPKLSKFITLRVKLQHTYVLINTLLIASVLVINMVINYITLINF